MRRKLSDANADRLPIYFVASSDGETPVNDPDNIAIHLQKGDAPEVVATGLVNIGGARGWHWWAPSATDLNTIGPVTAVAEADGCKRFPFTFEVHALSDAEVDAKIALLGSPGANITFIAAFSAGLLTIYKGAAYSIANGTSQDFIVATPAFPDLTGGAAKFRCKPPGQDAIIDYALAIANPGTTTQKIVWQLPVAESSKVRPPDQYLGSILYKAVGATEYSLAYEFPIQTRSM